MKTTVYSHSFLGKRENNEDALFTNNKDVYIVCDGVGGNLKGEVAANTVANYVGTNLTNTLSINDNFLKQLFVDAAKQLKKYEDQFPESLGLSTTIVAAVVQSSQILVAWCGDSRLYHIRNGKILYQTSDHSLVQQLFKQGIITFKEAKNHPKKNLLLQSINSNTTFQQIETHTINDCKQNDFLLLCTDGLLEVLENEWINNNFINNISINSLQEKLIELAANNTNDNCTWQLIHLQ